MNSNQSSTTTLFGMAHVMRLAFNGDDLAELTEQLVRRVNTNACDAAAMLDLSVVLQLNAQPKLAMQLQSQALRIEQQYQLHSNPRTPALRLLAIMGPGEVMANTPIEFLIEDCDIALQLLFLGEGLPAPSALPDHDLAFVAVCESDQNQALLAALAPVMQQWPRPFVNQPALIARLTRDRVARLLEKLDRVAVSQSQRWSRQRLEQCAAAGGCQFTDASFPWIIRPVNSHAGHGLSKLDEPAQIREVLQSHGDAEFFVAPFVDYRSNDGWFRKYRIAVIAGRPFAAHMAISRHWMVHYLNADMLGNQRNREEEAEFMANFENDFARRHDSALQAIDRQLGLDYYSIDCGETQDGRLLVFEVDSGAVVHSMDCPSVFPYKGPQMKKVFTAFRQMLLDRTQVSIVRQAA